MNPHFTKEETEQLVLRLRDLEKVCLATSSDLRPKIEFQEQKDFDYFDVLHTSQESRIEPNDLKQMWEPQEHLNARGLGYIKVNGEKWFYDKVSKEPRLFNQEGTKEIKLEFPFFIDGCKMWRSKETRPTLKKLIQECQKEFPPKNFDPNLFSEEFYQKLYNRTDGNKSIPVEVLKMMEILRRILIQKLTDSHLPLVQKSQVYKAFITENPSPTLSDKEKAIQCLKKEKDSIFLLAEKAKIIKKATRLIRYHQMRDNVRHPDEVQEVQATPEKIINDFYEALNLSEHKGKAGLSEDSLCQNFETSMAFEDLVRLNKILSEQADPTLKYGKEKFWQDLEQKGVLTPTESQTLDSAIKTGNCVAHANPGAPIAQKKLVDKDAAVIANAIIKRKGYDY